MSNDAEKPYKLTDHEVNAYNETITVLRGYGSAAAPWLYTVQFPNAPKAYMLPFRHDQDDGFTNEVLLAIVLDRLRAFQSGALACRENALAITKLEEALHWLGHRSKQRTTRGVEGTSQP